MNHKNINLGIVGFGGRGKSMFALAVDNFEGVNPAAICDNNDALFDVAQEKYPQTPTFTDFDEMIANTELDAVIVETPANDHAVYCVKVLENNIHVMSDIPCVYQLEEVEPLWLAEKKSKSIFMTGANPNCLGFIDKAVELKNSGLLGEPYYLEAEYVHELGDLFEITPWRQKLTPIQYCTHSLGPLLRLIDEDLKWVSCFGTGPHIRNFKGNHDAMVAIFKTRSNIVLRLLISFSNNFKGGTHSYRIFGTKGCFERTAHRGDHQPAKTLFNSIDIDNNKINELPIQAMREEYLDNPKAAAAGHDGTDYALMDNFFKAIRSDGKSPITLKEGLRMSLPGIFAAKSAENGGVLTELKYPWD